MNNLIQLYQQGVKAYLAKDLPNSKQYHQSLQKHYVYHYAKASEVDPVSYALDSILALHSKAWLQIEQAYSTQHFLNETQQQQHLMKVQGLLGGAEILFILLKNKIGFSQDSNLKTGFTSLETIQKILERKAMNYM